jgi:uncharacterized protein (TIGR02217 family)
MSFLETPRFPEEIALRSRGGPGYNTSIIVVRSGHESRNVNWSYPRHEYDVGYGIHTLDDLEELIEFFHSVGGRAYGFRYKDWADYKSVNTGSSVSYDDQDCDPATGDGVEDEFQLMKKYTKGAFSRQRIISKPVSGTVRVSINGSEKLQGDATYPWSIDTTTGIITFTSAVPPNTETVKAGYEFDVPVRFDTDTLSVSLETYQHAAAQVPLIEIRDIS